MLLMFEKRIRGGMCQGTFRDANGNNKYMNNYDMNKESSCIEYLDANNLYGYAMWKSLPVRNFKWLGKDDISKFNDELIKKYDENSDKGYIFEVDVEYPKQFECYIVIYHSYQKEWKLIIPLSLFVMYKTKKICSTHRSFKASIKSWIKINKNT